MTLRKQRLIKEILDPENKTLMDAGIKAGYSKKACNIYRSNIKEHITAVLKAQGISKESLGQAYTELIELCKKKGDTSTIKGALDSLGKLNKLLQDTNTQQVTAIFNDSLIQKLRDNIPLDVNSSNSKG